MESLFFHYLNHLQPYIYVIIFFAMIIEGEIFLFTVAFLVSRGIFDGWSVFWAVFLGVTVGDAFWFWLGKKIHHSQNRFTRWLVRMTGQMDEHLLDAPLRTIVISKFIYNLHHIMLVRAGVVGMKFKQFFKNDFISNVVWMVIVGGLGYFSGVSFDLYKKYLKFAEIAFFISLVIFLVIQYYFGKHKLKKKIVAAHK